MGRITLTEEQKRIAESIRSGQGAGTQQAPSAYRGGRITLNQKQIQIASKYGLPNPDYGKNAQSTQTTVDDPLHKQYAAFMAYQNAVREAELAQIEPGAALKGRASGEKKTENAGAAISGKVSQQEYSRSSAMQTQYGTYQNYLRGVEAAQGLKLGTLALQGQSALLAGRFAPATQQVREDVDAFHAESQQKGRFGFGTGKELEDGQRGRGKVSEQEFNRSEAMVAQYGSYSNYLQGVYAGYDEAAAAGTKRRAEAALAEGKVSEAEFSRAPAMVEQYGTYRNYLNGVRKSDDEITRERAAKRIESLGISDTLEQYYNAEGEEQAQLRQQLADKGVTGTELNEWRNTVFNQAGQFIGDLAAGFFQGGLLQNMSGMEGAMAGLENAANGTVAWALDDLSNPLPSGKLKTGIKSFANQLANADSRHEENARQLQEQNAQVMQQLTQGHSQAAKWIIEQMPSAGNMLLNVGTAGMAGVPNLAALGTTAGGNAYIEAKNDGATNEQALAYGIVNGSLEVLSEKLFGGNPLYDTDAGLVNQLVAKLTDNKTIMRILNSKGFDLLSEGLEEVVTEITEPWAQALIYAGKDAEFATWESVANAFAGGVFLSVVGNLADLPVSMRNREVQSVINDVTERVLYQAEQVADAGVQQAVADVREKMEYGEDVTAEDLGNVLNAMSEADAEVDAETVEAETAQAQEQAQAEADEKTFQIYKSAAETAQENQRLAQQYQQEQEQSRAQQSVQAVQQAQQAAQRQYDQDSLFAPIPGTENMGELDPVQYAKQQTADAEQALDEAALQQEEQYLQTQAQRAGYDEQTAAYFLNGNTTGMPAEQYAQSFGQVYEQGRLGASEQRAMRYAEGMNQDVAAAAYRAGLAAGQKGVNNGSIEVTDEGQVGQAGQRAEGQAGGVRQSTAQQQRADAGRKRAQGARDLAKAWDEVELSTLGLGKDNTQKVRIMPKGQEARSEDIQAAQKFFRSMGVQNARFFTGQLTQEIDGQTFYADAAVTEDGSVLIRADSEEYSAFELAKHEGYHLLVKRWPEMAAKIQKRLLGEGKITKEMIESYVDAYAGIYGDDTDAYVEEIVADTYAGMNRTDYGTNQLRADVKMEVGQWQKKTGSARAPPAKYSMVGRGENGLKTYKSDFSSDMTMDEKREYMYRLITEAWDEKPLNLTVLEDGKEKQITARFDGEANGQTFAGKMAYGNRRGSRTERLITLNLANDIWEIASESMYDNSKSGTKQTQAHDGTERWSYFTNAINYVDEAQPNRNGTYDFNLDVMRREDGDYVYTFYLKKRRTDAPRTFTAGVSSKNAANAGSSKNSISETGETVKGKFSASEDQTSAEQRKQNDKTALDYFGRTYKWSETGYVLLNGARLDFSGRHEGGPGGYRTVDHRDIIDALGEDYGGGDYSGGMVRFMQEGNIRISPESGGINLAVMPTKAQMDALGDFISKERGEVILDIDDAQGNTISSTEFSRGTHANKVLQAIRDYFENGTLPQADNTPSVSQFRYSSQEGRYRDLMGEKAAQYVRRLEAGLVNELAENLSVPGQAKREVLRPMAEEALRTFFTDGQLDRAKLNDLFETAYQAGIEEDTQYIEQYGDLKKFIRDQKLSISEKDRQDIADYNLFRKAAMGTLTISKDGLPVDVAYQQLQEMAPELFPADITAPSDQLMQIYDVARGIQKVQKTLDEYYGAQAASFKKWQQANFTESIDRLTSGLRVAQRYLDAQNKAKEKLAIPQTAEETKRMWAQLKDARRVVEKAQSKTLLTEADQKIVNRLLRGETSPDYVAGLENGQQILKVYEAKADYDMLALKLKAWNAQRKQGLRDFAEQALTEAEAVKWVDKTMGIQYQRETMERNIRDIARKGKVSDEKANAFINKYFWPVHENESKRKNYLVEQQNRIKALKLDRQVRKGNLVSESYAVQWLGEAEFNRDYLKQHPRVERRGGMTFDEWNAAIQEFEKQNPNLDLGKVRAAVKVFHEVYDKLFQDMNRVRIENGYEPVNYLQGYFPHFQENEEGGSILQKFARAAGIEGDVSPLPATINGLTANFKPGIRYMANIQNRLGYATAYDALQGFDRYIEVATDVIFHTADIQRLRALATQIRYRASDEGLKQRIDAIMMNPFLNPDEANEQVTNLTKEGRYGLSNFVDELDEYTNLLAGKKSRLDRGMEKTFGGRFYNVMKKFESRVGANMVAANVGSALTNFIPITQAWSQVSTADVLRGMWDTLKNYKTADGLDSASTFINNRSGYGRLAMSTMDKVSAGAGWMMESIDTFTTGSVVRARYYQNLRRGMSEMSAMQEADQFASGVMADRSKGSTPTLYSARNPLVKLFTQFQLEVNNELSWIFKDMAQEERKKGVAALAKAMFKFLIGAWIYNEFYESIAGRRAALDPLDIINDTVGDFTGYQLPNTVQAAVSGKWDFTKEKPGTYQAIKNLEGNIISEFPGTQALTILGVDEALGLDIDSGRIAVASAIPNLGNIEKAMLAKDEEMAPAKKAQTIGNELLKPGLYLATPFGGGQIRKAYQGATAAARGGSYSVDNEGRDILQYPVYNDNPADRAKSWAQALLFGKTATEEAQSWVESGFKSLSAKETAAYQGMTEGGEDQRETYAFIQAARKLEKNYDKMMLLKAYDISDAAKAEYYYQVLAGDTQKAEMEPKSTQKRIDYMNEKIQDAQEARQKQDLKDAVAAGTVTQEKAIQKILANDYAEDENKAYWLYKEWTGGKDYTKYGKILQTIEDGGDLKAAAKEYFDHGAEKGDIGSEITKAYKPQYIAASTEERKKLKEKLLAAYVALGFNRADKSKDIDKWLEDSK